MRFSLALITIILVSCSKPKEQTTQAAAPAPETYSFLGKPLYAKPNDSTALAKSDSIIAAIKNKSELTEEDFIDIGSLLVATNRWNRTIDNYSEGISKYPDSYKLLRHRGHRFINLRQLEKAIADLSKAEEMIRNEPEIWEYDAAGKPVATYQHQIWYHIGLYHFLNRAYAESAAAFEKSLATTHEGKNIAGASDWLYNAYQRAGRTDKTAVVLRPISMQFEIEDKDYPYYRRLLLYKGLITPEELIDINRPVDQMTLLEVTKLYGLANWYAYDGNKEKATELYKKILETKEWAAFAVAAAEKDLIE